MESDIAKHKAANHGQGNFREVSEPLRLMDCFIFQQQPMILKLEVLLLVT